MAGRTLPTCASSEAADTQRPRRGPGRSAAVLLAVVSTLLTLALVEGALRLQEPYLGLLGDRAEWRLGRYRSHPVWHHWLRPNSLTAQASLSPASYPEPMVFATNAVGCRDRRDLSASPRPGTRRILVMGDSFTEGYYDGTTFANVLESRLNDRGSATAFEVINCGTASYSPLLHYIRYTRQLRELNAHELIVNVDLTDLFDDNRRYRAQATFADDGRPLAASAPHTWQRRVADALKYRFYAARLVFGRPGSQIEMPITENVFAYHREGGMDAADWEREVGFTLGVLQHLIDATAQDGVRLILTMYPYQAQYESIGSDPQWTRAFERRVEALARANDVPFYSAFEDLKPHFERGVPLYWKNDFHFAPIGQRAWALSFASHYVSSLLGDNE